MTSRAQPTKMVLLYSPSTLLLMGRITNRGRVATRIIKTIRPLGGKCFIFRRFSLEARAPSIWKNSLTMATMSLQ